MQKLYDAVVKVGEYTDQQGNPKGRYENVGAVMQGDNGPFLILKRTFSPAGVPNPDNKDSVIVSLFEPSSQGQQQGGSYNNQGQAGHNHDHQQGGYGHQNGFNPNQGR